MRKNIKKNGSSLIEFTLLLPLFLVLLFGIMEFGIMIYDKALITNASREIARSSIALRVPALTGSQLITQGNLIRNNYCGNVIGFAAGSTCTSSLYYNNSTTAVSNTSTPVITISGVPFKAVVNYTYTTLVIGNLLNLIGSGSFSSTLNLSATTVMNTE